ncbi:MAG: DMT family transporter [Pseudanabaenaceae cyanobacterium]
MNPWAWVGMAALNNAIGSLMLKQSRMGAPPGWKGLLGSPWFWGGLVFYGVNVLIFAKALESLPVSAAYPVLAGLGFAAIALGGVYFFGEGLGWSQGLGMAIIVVGIGLVARR